MPEVKVKIGGRDYEVACQPGEEQFLRSAAAMLDVEAAALADMAGRLPESRMLLMAGLMLADKTAGLDEQMRAREVEVQELQGKIAALERAEPPAPERVEVPVIPASVLDTMAELAAHSEALADAVEEKAAGDSAA
ncbi:cell division protein ZapA [Maribius pontilimi]|uniref:Cell division protein ZapA n=1 Tax=Palleronia pontilimi TaxID=1964209 RepID=A0A934ICE3_9RHOB|nr:cell division protein ZapA [Palleronia pontilimi]MBJ3761872.1 cell division protein ZapA [Palleronia pontilimi]